jgi:hypothetical protein
VAEHLVDDLRALGRHARGAPRVIVGLPMEALRRRADGRRTFKRSVRGSVALAALALVLFSALVDVGHHHDDATMRAVDAAQPATTGSSEATTTSTAAPTTTAAASPLNEATAPAAPAALAEPAEPSTVTPPPEPPPTTVRTTPPGLDLHGLGTDGLRPLAFGSSVAEAERVTGQHAVPFPVDVCEPHTTLHVDPAPGLTLHFPNGGPLRYIQVMEPGVATLSGIEVGTPLATLRAKLPGLEQRELGGYGYFVLWSADHRHSIAFFPGNTDRVGMIIAADGDVEPFVRTCN